MSGRRIATLERQRRMKKVPQIAQWQVPRKKLKPSPNLPALLPLLTDFWSWHKWVRATEARDWTSLLKIKWLLPPGVANPCIRSMDTSCQHLGTGDQYQQYELLNEEVGAVGWIGAIPQQTECSQPPPPQPVAQLAWDERTLNGSPQTILSCVVWVVYEGVLFIRSSPVL